MGYSFHGHVFLMEQGQKWDFTTPKYIKGHVRRGSPPDHVASGKQF